MDDTTGKYQRLEMKALLLELQDDLDDLIGHLNAGTMPTREVGSIAMQTMLDTLAHEVFLSDAA